MLASHVSCASRCVCVHVAPLPAWDAARPLTCCGSQTAGSALLASFASCAAATRLVEGIHGRLHSNMEGVQSLLVVRRGF